MSIVIRPTGSAGLSQAVEYVETGLPQTITGLAAGNFDVGRMAWAPAPVVVTAASRPDMFADGDWDCVNSPSTGGDKLSVNIIRNPASVLTITRLEYRVGSGGAAQTFTGGITAGARLITVPAYPTSSAIYVRAVADLGGGDVRYGDWSLPKTRQPTVTTVANQVAKFPAATPAGAGGWQPFGTDGTPVALTGAVTVASGTPVGTWSVASGELVCSAAAAGNNGVVLNVTTVTGVSLQATIDTSLSGEAIANMTQFAALIASSARLSSKTHIFRSRTFNLQAIASYNGLFANSGAVVFLPERTDVQTAILTGQILIGTTTSVSNVLFQDLRFFMPSDPTKWVYGDPAYGRIMIDISVNATNVEFRNCEIYSDLARHGEGGFINEDVKGIRIRGTNNIVRGCYIHDVYTGAQPFSGANVLLENNVFDRISADGINPSNCTGTLILRGNREINKSHWGSIIHGDNIQMQGNNTADLIIEGHVSCPGVYGMMRPGLAQSGLPDVSLSATQTLTVLAHANRRVVPTVAGYTFTLPPLSGCFEQEFTIFGGAAGVGCTVALSAGDTHDNLTFPQTVAPGAFLTVRGGSVKWGVKQAGTRAGTLIRTVVTPLTEAERQRHVLYDTTIGAMAVQLPATPNTGDWYGIDVKTTTGNAVTITALGGLPISYRGQTVTSVSVATIFQGKQFVYDGTKWVAYEFAMGNQGFFSNAYIYGSKVTMRGCIIWVNQAWGYRIEAVADASNLPTTQQVNHNWVVPYFAQDWNGDGWIGPDDGSMINGIEGTIEVRGNKTFICDGNIANKITEQTLGGFLSNNIAVGVAMTDNNSPAKLAAVMGINRARWWPHTLQEAIDFAAFAPASPYYGQYIGPHAVWDFAANTARTIPAPVIRTLPATLQADLPVSITFSMPIQKGTGNIVLRNVTTGADIETFDVAASGRVTIAGPVLRIAPTALLVSGNTYAIRIAATAIDSIYATDFAGITNNSTTFVATEVAAYPTLRLLAEGTLTTAVDKFETTTFKPTGLWPVVVIVPARAATASPLTKDSATIGVAARAYATGDALPDLVNLAPAARNQQAFAWLLADPSFADQTVQIDLSGTFTSKYYVYEIVGGSKATPIGASITASSASATSAALTLATTKAKSTVLAVVTLNSNISIATTDVLVNNTVVTAAMNVEVAKKEVTNPGSITTTFSWASAQQYAAFALELLAS